MQRCSSHPACPESPPALRPTPLSRRSLLGRALRLSPALLLGGCIPSPPVVPSLPPPIRGSKDIVAESERIGRLFRRGLFAGFETEEPADLLRLLADLSGYDRPFAWEGVGMAVAYVDSRGKSDRWGSLLRGVGAGQAVALHLGLGWARSWIGSHPEDGLPELAPLMKWRVLEGHAFRSGFVGARRRLLRDSRPSRMSPFASEIWDEGIGRAGWYWTGGDVQRLAGILGAFPAERSRAMWRGVGIGATFLGSLDPTPIRALAALSSPAADLAVGAAMAVHSRLDAGSLGNRQTLPCRLLTGLEPGEAAALVASARTGLEPTGSTPMHARWLGAVRGSLSDGLARVGSEGAPRR